MIYMKKSRDYICTDDGVEVADLLWIVHAKAQSSIPRRIQDERFPEVSAGGYPSRLRDRHLHVRLRSRPVRRLKITIFPFLFLI